MCACGCKTAKSTADADKTESATTATSSTKKDCKLTETKWMLTHVFSKVVEDSPERPYIVFVGDRITGSLGCNTFFGTFYVKKKGKIDMEYTGSTKKLCNEMKVEREFISALKVDKKSYVIKENILIIRGEKMMDDGTKKDVEILRFKAEQ